MPVSNARRISLALSFSSRQFRARNPRPKFASTQPLRRPISTRARVVAVRSRAWRSVVFRQRQRVSRNQLADYYLNGYWYDSAYLRVVHHGANSTVVILISGVSLILVSSLIPCSGISTSVPPVVPCCCRVPSRALVPTTYAATRAALSPLYPVSACSSGTTRRINVCFQDFWLSAE